MAKRKRKKSGKTLKRLKRNRAAAPRVKAGPKVPTDIRGLINPWPPQFPKEWQLKVMAPFGVKEVYTVGHGAETHQGFAESAREGSAMWVAECALLAEIGGGKAKMVASMLRNMSEIHVNGGFVWEGTTGMRSDRPADRAGMIARATDILGRIAQGARSITNPRKGKPPHDYSKDECRVMLAIKHDRRYKNWPERAVAMKRKGIKPVPGRTWFVEKLEAFARNLGVES